MWPFRKPPSDLKSDEQDRLMRLFEHAPQLKAGVEPAEQLTMIFDTARSKAAGPPPHPPLGGGGRTSGLMCFKALPQAVGHMAGPHCHYSSSNQTSGVWKG